MNFGTLFSAMPAVVTGTIGDGYSWSEAGMLALSGIVIVFLMLELLVIITKLFGKIMDSVNGNNKGGKSPKKEDKAPVNKATSLPVSNTAQSELSGEIVAAIAAAVDCYYSDSSVKPVIRSIKPATSGRSAWSTAGILDNTRPF